MAPHLGHHRPGRDAVRNHQDISRRVGGGIRWEGPALSEDLPDLLPLVGAELKIRALLLLLIRELLGAFLPLLLRPQHGCLGLGRLFAFQLATEHSALSDGRVG